MSCPDCNGEGFIEVCYNGNPDACGLERCPTCNDDEPNPRERGDDDGCEYADPRDYRDGLED